MLKRCRFTAFRLKHLIETQQWTCPPRRHGGVSGGGEVLQTLPQPSQLYAASRRTSDRQLPAARRCTGEARPGRSPAIESAGPSEQQDESGPAAADEISASAAQSVDPSARSLTRSESEARGSVVAVNEEDVALVALAERKARGS